MAAKVIPHGGFEILVWLHAKKDPPRDEWDRCHANVCGELQRLGSQVATRRGFVVSDGGAPNTKQRADCARDIWAGATELPVAVITPTLDNPVKRGIATALMWLQPQLKFMRPSQWQEALRHLGLETGDVLLDAICELQREVTPVQVATQLIEIARRHKLSRTG